MAYVFIKWGAFHNLVEHGWPDLLFADNFTPFEIFLHVSVRQCRAVCTCSGAEKKSIKQSHLAVAVYSPGLTLLIIFWLSVVHGISAAGLQHGVKYDRQEEVKGMFCSLIPQHLLAVISNVCTVTCQGIVLIGRFYENGFHRCNKKPELNSLRRYI